MFRKPSFVAASVAAAVALAAWPAPVAAECPYLPPWPGAAAAIPSALEVLIGEVVSDFEPRELHLAADQAPRDYALRVVEVLRGNAQVGDLRDIQYLLPNWPQMNPNEFGGPFPSCTYLRTQPGDVIVLAMDALQPGGPMRDVFGLWVQPPTRYNAMSVVEGEDVDANWERERLTRDDVRRLAALPPTDSDALGPGHTTRTGKDLGPMWIAALAGLAGALICWRRLSRTGARSGDTFEP